MRRKRGGSRDPPRAAIAIAHPRPSKLAVLREEVPKAKAEGFTFVPVSSLLDRSGQPL